MERAGSANLPALIVFDRALQNDVARVQRYVTLKDQVHLGGRFVVGVEGHDGLVMSTVIVRRSLAGLREGVDADMFRCRSCNGRHRNGVFQ